ARQVLGEDKMSRSSCMRRAHRALNSASPMVLAAGSMMLLSQPAFAQAAPQPQTAPQSAPERMAALPPAAQQAEAAADAPALPQDSYSGPDITVTATRIVRDGYSAPTPLTVFGEEDIARAGAPNVFQAAVQLPSLAGSNSTSTFGTTQSTGT